MASPIDNTRAQKGTTRGVVYVHDAGKAFCKPIEWTLSEVLGYEALLHWIPQPITPGRMRAEISWVGLAGTGNRLVQALQQIPELRFEVTEEPSIGCEGERFAFTPALGVFRAHMSVHGDVLVTEQRIRNVLEATDDPVIMRNAFGLMLGIAWDRELEPFRVAGEGTPVRWLHQVAL